MFFWSVIIVLMIALAAFSWWQMRAQNTFVVLPGQKERLVLQNLEGKRLVLSEGTHSMGAEWRTFLELGINRETISVEKEEATTANTVVLAVKLGFDIILGREFDPNHGLLVDSRNPDDKKRVNNDLLADLVTLVDIKNKEHHKIALRAVKGALERTIGQYTSKQLLSPNRLVRKPQIPLPNGLMPEEIWIATHPDLRDWMADAECEDKNDVLSRLARLIELRANFELRHLAINIIALRVLDIDVTRDKTQANLEAAAGAKALQRMPKVKGLTQAQVLAANTDQAGMTNLGEGLSALARALVQMVKEYKKP